MYNFSIQKDAAVIIDDGTRKWSFPKGVLTVHANAGDNQSVDLRLLATRKNVLSFRYDQCNLAGKDAQETAENIGKII